MYNKSLRQNNQDVAQARTLVDLKKNGKTRPWRKYKLQSSAISKSYSFFDELKKLSYKIADCGSFLNFKSCMEGHFKKLVGANFCRARLCTICQWRRSLVIFHQVLELVHAHRETYKSDIPLLLTLTVPNIKGEQLKETLDQMQRAFIHNFIRRKKIKAVARSWFRSLEITCNRDRDDYHPHFHVLLLVPRPYFETNRDLYIDRDEWLSMWQKAMKNNNITQVDIRRVRKKSEKQSLEAVAAEVSKYATKPSSYLEKQKDGTFEAANDVIKTLHNAIKGRRLVAFGGLFLSLRKKLKMTDVEKADLINIDDEIEGCQCPICESTLVSEMFQWNIGFKTYKSITKK